MGKIIEFPHQRVCIFCHEETNELICCNFPTRPTTENILKRIEDELNGDMVEW